MEIVEQINQICIETKNEWFLQRENSKAALSDLELKEQLEREDIFDFDERKCVCNQEPPIHCACCEIEMERYDVLEELKLNKIRNNVYDWERDEYAKNKWIIPEKIDGEIPGFILINDSDEFESTQHELVFACVRHKYRRRGILKDMVNSIPKEWSIWLEANSQDIEDIGNVWERCGFSHHTTMKDMCGEHLIYKNARFK